MSFYNWIQKVLFENYEEWHMKDPLYDGNGFHISGIDNTLKAMHDGYIFYTELTPSHAVKGCTLMKAVVGKSKELVNLYLKIEDKKYLISETVEFIKQNYKKYNFHIVSGSDEKELNYLCEKLDLSKFFKTIEGSPTPKNELVKNILGKYNYNSNECILIGDSVNDYEAAYLNKIKFYGYNNEKLKNKADYIEDFYIFKIKE